jgi:5,10-methylenetetrahydrofolate reductase
VSDANDIVVDLLRRPRLEVMPLEGIEQEVIAHVPSQLTITVTSSPSRGIDATLSVCERLVAHGYRVVPHLAARLVIDRVHLRELLARLDELGLREVFVVAGDIGQHAGEFEGAAALLPSPASASSRLRACTTRTSRSSAATWPSAPSSTSSRGAAAGRPRRCQADQTEDHSRAALLCASCAGTRKRKRTTTVRRAC